MPNTAVNAETLSDRFEEDILFGRLRPRERLVEDELIDRTGATRHAVRQALAELESRQLVVRVPNKGAQVRDFSRAELTEVCQMRDWLHELAARNLVLPADPDWVVQLQALQRTHAEAVERADPVAIHRTNNAFHNKLFAGCGNRYLAQTIYDYAQMSLAYRCHLMTRMDMAQQARDEHRQMVEAIRANDTERLAQLCVRHTSAARQVYESLQGWQQPRP